jgi:hypothetical protein
MVSDLGAVFHAGEAVILIVTAVVGAHARTIAVGADGRYTTEVTDS